MNCGIRVIAVIIVCHIPALGLAIAADTIRIAKSIFILIAEGSSAQTFIGLAITIIIFRITELSCAGMNIRIRVVAIVSSVWLCGMTITISIWGTFEHLHSHFCGSIAIA